MNEPKFLIVDLFCGAGGTTTGFEMAGDICKVLACVNHDPLAIESHWRNYPDVVHFEEDIRTLKLQPLRDVVNINRRRFPDAKVILWASLECTNFSKAKGGLPRDADSRTLADHLHRYITALTPDYVQIENVVEFMSWGPLDENGKPLSRKNGSEWLRWRKEVCAHGYYDEWMEMNSANYGAYTSRNRLFGCFARHHLPIVWPDATHSKKPAYNGLYGDSLKPWKAVKDVLNFDDEGISIFNRKKPLSDKTLERIYAGLTKYVAKGNQHFISKYYSGRPSGKNIAIDGPAGTITTIDGQALVQSKFLLKYNSTNKNGKHIPPSIDDPCPVISTQGRLGVVQGEFLQHYYGNGFTTSTNEPCPTITTKERAALVQPKYFIYRDFKSETNSGIDAPAGALTTVPKMNLVEAEPFVMPTDFNNKPKDIHQPLSTITASRRHHYIVNPSWGGNTGSVEEPCCVIVARQDKSPLYLIQCEEGIVTAPVYDNDSETMIRIKEFMVLFGLVDIKMRMLRIDELLKIQGFPENYQLAGNQTDQKKFIGNSVVPHVVKAWVEAMGERINEKILIA